MVMRVLIAEDEAVVALDLSVMVEDLGHDVIGPAYSLDQGLALARASPKPDFAVLDVNLKDDVSLPIADILMERDVPFIFLSGYQKEFLPSAYVSIPLLAKPCTNRQLADILNHRGSRH